MLEEMTENRDRAIGRIEGKLDRIIDEMKLDSEKREEQDKRLERIERSQDNADKRTEDILKRLETVEKPVAEFNRWRERAIGALMLVSLVAALIGGSIAAYWHKIVETLRSL